jgi:hypothetical protein
VSRRRRPVEAVAVPMNLVVFEGFRYRTDAAWASAFAEFRAAREARAAAGLTLEPYEVKGECPFDRSRFVKSAG